MSTTTPTTAPAPVPVGLLARLKLTEPVRLYTWPALLGTLLVVIAAALADTDLVVKVAGGVAWLALVVATEAARASVFSPRSTVQAVRRAAGQ
jgi:hypothetical protein